MIPAKHQIITFTLLSDIAASPNSKWHNQSLQLGQMRGQTGAGLRVSDEQGPPPVGHHHQSAGKRSLIGSAWGQQALMSRLNRCVIVNVILSSEHFVPAVLKLLQYVFYNV